MIRALLREQAPKTQTRRTRDLEAFTERGRFLSFNFKTGIAKFGDSIPDDPVPVQVKCPYGVPGDLLWVREGCWIYGVWRANGISAKGRKLWRFEAIGQRVIYDKLGDSQPDAFWGGGEGFTFRPSIHMPRWASRITLELTGVRVERVQDISEEDARSEGVVLGEPVPVNFIVKQRGKKTERSKGVVHDFTYRGAYCRLWDQINGAESWKSNPWCWVLSFRRVAQVQEVATNG